MKYLILAAMFAFITISSFAQKNTISTKESIKVYGNCETCKKHIESAAKAAGASVAVWNEDTKMLAVTYDKAKTSNQKIQESIAAVGYDTQDMKGNDAAYKKLNECCQYERKK